MNYQVLDKALFDFYHNKITNKRDYYSNNRNSVNTLIEFGYISGDINLCDFYITQSGMEMCKNGGMEKEQENIKRQEEFIDASIKLADSTISTQATTRKLQIITIIIAGLTLCALVTQVIIAFCK